MRHHVEKVSPEDRPPRRRLVQSEPRLFVSWGNVGRPEWRHELGEGLDSWRVEKEPLASGLTVRDCPG
jgi:hypothetical protein